METEITPTTAVLYGGVFLLFTAVFLTMLAAFGCTSDTLAQAMTFAMDIPDGESVSTYLQSQFETCMFNRVLRPNLVFISAGSAGIVTLMVYTWYNIDIPFDDWLGF